LLEVYRNQENNRMANAITEISTLLQGKWLLDRAENFEAALREMGK